MRVILLSFCLMTLCAGCKSANPVLLAKAVPHRTLLILNPEKLDVELARVNGESIHLGMDEEFSLNLESDRYVLNAHGVVYPVPLLAAILDPKEPLVVSVEKPPSTPSGFAYVPGGPTLVGDLLGVGSTDERPARLEIVESLFVAKTETTNAQYVEFLNGKGDCKDDWLDLGGPKCRIKQDVGGMFITDAPQLPVVTVSYFGALAYCEWLSQESGRAHRPPTEYEWERFARGPNTRVFSYGDVYLPKAANQESGRLSTVKSFSPTEWGLYDVTGNAFEWTSSDYEEGLKVLRGGSYILEGPFLRNSFRMWYRPLVQADDIGFRVIQEIGQ